MTTLDPHATVIIRDAAHAGRLAMHLGRLTGARFAMGVTAQPTTDARALVQQIRELAPHSHVTGSADGLALIAYGRALEAEVLAADTTGKEVAGG